MVVRQLFEEHHYFHHASLAGPLAAANAQALDQIEQAESSWHAPSILAGQSHGLVSQTWKAFNAPRTSGQRARARVRSRFTGSGWSSYA